MACVGVKNFTVILLACLNRTKCLLEEKQKGKALYQTHRRFWSIIIISVHAWRFQWAASVTAVVKQFEGKHSRMVSHKNNFQSLGTQTLPSTGIANRVHPKEHEILSVCIAGMMKWDRNNLQPKTACSTSQRTSGQSRRTTWRKQNCKQCLSNSLDEMHKV